jgi:hypothetical protein
MFLRFGCAVWVLGMVAAEPPDPVIANLVNRLGASSFRDRQQAQQSLLALGDPAVPKLRAAMAETTDQEVERRLEVIVGTLERDKLIRPSRVTLKGTKTFTEVTAALAAQTGYVIQNPGGTDVKLTVDWLNKPFWEAVEEMTSETGRLSNVNDADGSIAFYDYDIHNPFVHVSGPFRLLATNIGSNRNLQLSGLPRRTGIIRQADLLHVNLQLTAEPKSPILACLPVKISKAVDDQDQNLVISDTADQAVSNYPNYGGRSANQYLWLSLTRPHRDATVIRELVGTVGLVLLAGTKPEITVEKLDQVKDKTFVGRTTELHVQSVSEPNAGGFTIQLTARHLRPLPNDSTWGNTIVQRFEVYDAAGQKFSLTNSNDLAAGNGQASLSMSFGPPPGKAIGRPSKLVFLEYQTTFREIPFRFENLPLP